MYPHKATKRTSSGWAPHQADRGAEEPGQRLKRIRERLNLRYRDVEEASQRIALRHGNDEFTIALSRLADIENKGTVPSIYRLYSLCVIYRLDPVEVLSWYGVDLSQLPVDAGSVEIETTHPVGFASANFGEVSLPILLDPGLDVRKTTYISRMIQRWGTLPLMMLSGLDPKNQRYALVGTEDWSMYPLLSPGSLVVIDETRRKVVNAGWTNEFERPIYFLEHRDGYFCGWCSLSGGQLVVQPHPASPSSPESYRYPKEIDVIGQVTAVAMRLDQAKKRRIRS